VGVGAQAVGVVQVEAEIAGVPERDREGCGDGGQLKRVGEKHAKVRAAEGARVEDTVAGADGVLLHARHEAAFEVAGHIEPARDGVRLRWAKQRGVRRETGGKGVGIAHRAFSFVVGTGAHGWISLARGMDSAAHEVFTSGTHRIRSGILPLKAATARSFDVT